MKTKTLIFAIVALTFTAVSGYAAGKLYKWTDENGVVHYGDKIPPQYAKDQRQVLNDQGMTVKTLQAQKSQEQLDEAAAQKKAEEEKAKEQTEHAARDKMLLDTYTSVDDIKQARDSRLQAIEGQVKITSTTIDNLQNTLVGLDNQVKNLKSRNQPVPDSLQQELDKTSSELLDNQKFLVGLQKKQDAVKAEFGDDIVRFEQLTDTTKDQKDASGN